MRRFYLIAACMFAGTMSYSQVISRTNSEVTVSNNIEDIKKQYLYEVLHNPTEQNDNDDDNELARFNRWYNDMRVRCYPSGELPSPATLLNAHYAQSLSTARRQTSVVMPAWEPVGPMNVPTDNNGIGRINCIVIDPVDTNKLYIGAACGGVFVSHDGGATWTSNSDHFPSLSIADIAVNPHNTDTIYAATGDGYGYEGGLYYIFWGGLYTAGVMMSTDGGNSWNTTGLSYLQSNNDIIQKLLIHPNKTSILLAATRNGIKRSTDAGATWTTVDAGHVYSMAFKPGSPDTVYALNQTNLRVSYNAGATWQNLYPAISSVNDRSTIAVSAVAPTAVWVLTASNTMKISHDCGHTFDTTSPPDTANFYGYYDRVLAVSPKDSDYVIACGMIMAKSADACSSWDKLNPYFPVHVDNHAIAINPQNPSTIYTGNDGGISVTHDGGYTWANLSNGLMISQIYRLSTSRQDPNFMLCGLQDNGTIHYDGTSWQWVSGGDGEACAINPQNDLYEVSSYQNGHFYFSEDEGYHFAYTDVGPTQYADWTAPVVYDPVNTNNIYFGYNDIYATHDGGVTFSSLTHTKPFTSGCSEMAISSSNPGVLYAADLGHIMRSNDAGVTWTNVTGNLPVNLVGITRIAVDFTDPMTVYVTTSGYVAGMKVFMSSTGGTTWTNISGALPNIPADCIAIDSSTPGALFVGTDMGVYYKDATQPTWTLYGTGLPNVIVDDLDINYADYRLRVATYGRGVWKTKLQKDPSTGVSSVGAALPLKLQVSPNPTKNSWKLRFQKQQPGNYIVNVSDIAGRLLLTVHNSDIIDASGLSGGVYNIEVVSENGRYHAKAVKE